VPTTTDLWTDVHEEREALLDLLETLSPEQWETPSLCSDWRVRDVVAHIVSGTNIKVLRAVASIAASGFRMNRYISKDARRKGAAPIDTLLADYRVALPTRTHPPGQSVISMLEDIVLHQIDIRRPLDQPRTTPLARMVQVAAGVHGDRIYPGTKLFRGLRATATDVEWSIGDGPEVSGPIESLALSLSGRLVALDELGGDGMATLRKRTASLVGA